jgi:hypothetical protein
MIWIRSKAAIISSNLKLVYCAEILVVNVSLVPLDSPGTSVILVTGAIPEHCNF